MSVLKRPIQQVTVHLAALHGAPPEALEWLADVTDVGWVAFSPEGEVQGAAAARPSPQHGAEIMGGAFPGQSQREVAMALLHTVQTEVGALYVYADPTMLPVQDLLDAGFREVGAYRRLQGRVPYRHVEPPAGVRILPLYEVTEQGTRRAAFRTFEDRIGHHSVNAEAVADGAGGFDPHLSFIALDERGQAVGLCRAGVQEGAALLDSPGVHPDWRATTLRSALLNAVFTALRADGVPELSLESWGDTPGEVAHDLKLNLVIVEETPLLASPNSRPQAQAASDALNP